MTIPNCNTNYVSKSFLNGLILSIAFLVIVPIYTFGQNTQDDVKLVFVKTNDSIKSSSLYFNVLKIQNKSLKPVTGKVNFSAPENWKLILFPEEQITILPGDSTMLPVRLSPSAEAVGGITYILNANFRSSQRIYSTNTYLTIPSFSKWDFATYNSSLYFTENEPNVNFQVKLTNRGNTNELIKVQVQVGKLLAFPNNINDNFVDYVKLSAFKDTLITYFVTYQTKLSYEEKMKYESNWKESSIRLIASTESFSKSASILIHKLNSTFFNQRLQNSSPLNIDYQAYNIMSNQDVRSNIKFYGDILYPKNRELQYAVGAQNLSMDNQILTGFDLNRQLMYSLLYNDKRSNIFISNNVSGGELHTINGRGIIGAFKVTPNDRITYSFTQNPFNQTIGENLGYRTSFRNFSINTEVTHENDYSNSYQATSALLGAGFTLFKHHSITFELLGSQAKYNLNSGKDTSLVGYSYKIYYSAQYKNFELRFNAMNSAHNYIQNSGLEQYYLDSKLKFSDNVSLSLYGNRMLYATTRYPYNFYTAPNYSSSDYLRLTTSISSGGIIYQIGPSYNGSMRQLFNSAGYNSEYLTYQPGIWAAATFKLNGYRSITPNITISNLRFYYTSQDPTSQNYSSDKNIYYSVGLNYFDNIWRVNAYYSSGSTSDLYRSVLVDSQPVVSKSIQVRPSYENFFFNRKVKLSAYVNYAYYMPSGRENISYNVKYDQFLKHGIVLSVSGFMYSNIRVDPNLGRIDTKDFNFVIGISKSFNIQQPRLKYYNLKTVFFNDLDGNGIKTENEPPVSNILVDIQKDRRKSNEISYIPEIQLLSDFKGSIEFDNLPKDNYKLTFTPLVNLQSLYFIKGSEQPYYNDKDRTLYVPLAESYKIKGKIILVRDLNSSEGKIDLGNIRITAIGPKGETYSSLTDNFGNFILSVPKADKFKVHINNVFGERFYIDSNESEVQFTENKTINLDFVFIEKKRGIEFDGGGELFKFTSLDSQSEVPAADSLKAAKSTTTENYAIQLSATKTYRSPSYFKSKYKLKEEVYYYESNGLYKYYTGSFTTKQAAKAALSKLGITAIPVAIDKSLLKTGVPEPKPAPVLNQPVTAVSTPTSYKTSSKTGIVTTAPSESVISPVETAQQQQGYLTSKSVNTDIKPVENTQPVVSQPETINAGSNQLSINTNQPVKTKVPSFQSSKTSESGLTIVDGKVISNKPVVETNKNWDSTTNSYKKPTILKSENATNQEPSITKPVSKKTESAIQSINSNQPVETPVKKVETAVSSTDKTSNAKSDNKVNTQSQISQPVLSKVNVPVKNQLPVTQSISPKTQPLTKQIANAAVISGNKPDEKAVTSEVASQDNPYLYTIQLDVQKSYIDPAYYKEKYNLKEDVFYMDRNGEFRYFTGNYSTIEAAKAAITRYGLMGYIVKVDRSLLKKRK